MFSEYAVHRSGDGARNSVHTGGLWSFSTDPTASKHLSALTVLVRRGTTDFLLRTEGGSFLDPCPDTC